MAIKIYDQKKRKWIELTNSQIKSEIIRNLGLDTIYDIRDPKQRAELNKEYRRQYDIMRKRVRNYNNLLELEGSTQVSANEVWLRITRRQLQGEELTAQQKAIVSTSSVNTNIFRRRISTNTEFRINTARSILESEYAGLLRDYKYGKRQYEAWLMEPVNIYTNITTGEIIYLDIDDTRHSSLEQSLQWKLETIKRENIVTVKEIKDKLGEIASQLHAAQARARAKNKATYDKEIFYEDTYEG